MGFWQSLKKTLSGKANSPEELFIEEYTAIALEHPDVERVERSPDEPMLLLIFRSDRDAHTQSFLGNIFQETRELSPEQRRERIRRALTILDQEEVPSWEDAEGSLVPLVRVESILFNAPAELVSRAFVPFVNLYVGLDHDHTIQYVNESHLEKWDVDGERVFGAAIDVLARHHTERDVEPFDAEASYPIFHVTRDDSYESSRIALPGFLAGFRGKVPGRPIAIIPERSTCIVSGDGSPEAIERLARYAEKESQSAPRSLSPAIYTLAEDGLGIVPLHVSEAHPKYFLVERGHKLLAAGIYAEQKAMLEKRYERDGTDIFVASLSVVSHNETRETTTYATFLKGVDTLMPEADLMAVGEGEGGFSGMVPWAKVFEHAPECFEKDPSLSPIRWRTVGWPNDEAFARIRAAAVQVLKA